MIWELRIRTKAGLGLAATFIGSKLEAYCAAQRRWHRRQPGEVYMTLQRRGGGPVRTWLRGG